MATKKDISKGEKVQKEKPEETDNVIDNPGGNKETKTRQKTQKDKSDSKAKAAAVDGEKKKSEKTDKEEDPAAVLKEKLSESQDKYLRLSAEFDNYRKRTLKEKMELTKSAGESIISNLLPVMDDFDRALQVMQEATDCAAMKEGIDLIYNKFNEFLKTSGVKEIDALNKEFDTDLHEAITKIPAPEEEMKGKVVDVIQKGYYLNDKVMRYAKVVIGE